MRSCLGRPADRTRRADRRPVYGFEDQTSDTPLGIVRGLSRELDHHHGRSGSILDHDAAALFDPAPRKRVFGNKFELHRATPNSRTTVQPPAAVHDVWPLPIGMMPLRQVAYAVGATRVSWPNACSVAHRLAAPAQFQCLLRPGSSASRQGLIRRRVASNPSRRPSFQEGPRRAAKDVEPAHR